MAEGGRGMDPYKEMVWKNMYKKEDLMKLKWFHKNQQRLVEIVERESLRKGLSPEILQEVERMRQERYRNVQRRIKQKGKEIAFPEIDPFSIMNVMKPIDGKTKELLYNNKEKEGRKNYLKARYKIDPDDRYYFPESSGLVYGWKIVENSKGMEASRFGRRQVIKNSFYRRRGLLKRDPDHYRLPQEDSPIACGCI